MSVPTAYTLELLLAREEITDVVKRLARGTDRLDAELIVSCYHDDGYDDHNAFRGTAAEFATWVCEVLPHFAATMHFIGPPLIDVDWEMQRRPGRSPGGRSEIDPRTTAAAQVDTYCVAHHVSKPDADGVESDMILGLRYVDRFECRDGRWLIAKRVCAFDWTTTVAVDAATRYQFEDGWTVGARDRSDITYRGV